MAAASQFYGQEHPSSRTRWRERWRAAPLAGVPAAPTAYVVLRGAEAGWLAGPAKDNYGLTAERKSESRR